MWIRLQYITSYLSIALFLKESAPALRWLLSNPNLDTYISGIKRVSDVDAAIAAAEAGPFSAADLARVNKFIAGQTREAAN